MIKYWLKIIKQEPTNLCKAAYDMQLGYLEVGRKTWAGEVKQILFKYGFGEVWEYQQVGNKTVCMSEFSTRLKDISLQEWSAEITNNKRLICYSAFKTELNIEPYLSSKFYLRTFIAKLSFSSHGLKIE